MRTSTIAILSALVATACDSGTHAGSSSFGSSTTISYEITTGPGVSHIHVRSDPANDSWVIWDGVKVIVHAVHSPGALLDHEGYPEADKVVYRNGDEGETLTLGAEPLLLAGGKLVVGAREFGTVEKDDEVRAVEGELRVNGESRGRYR